MSIDSERIEFDGAMWLTVGGETLGGGGRIELLAQIHQHGSITQAAKAIGMSYKAAWDAIDAMNQLTGQPLVLRSTGGKGGGGTQLTERAQRLVKNFSLIEAEHLRFLAELSQRADGMTEDYLLLQRLSMKTSARNQFLGKVSQIKTGAVNDEIELEVAGGHKLVAVVTRDSTESLGLQLGVEAFALIKASSVIVVADEEGARFSARNRLFGVISRIQAGAVNTEVVVELSGGLVVVAMITNHSSSSLELVQGQTVSVIFKASSVILGRPV